MKEPSIYFYVLPVENGGYQHNAISLAQGLSALGIPFGASSDYWKQADGTYLFQHDPAAKPSDFDVVLVTEQYMTYGNGQLPTGFFELPGKKVLIHTGDGLAHQYNMGKLRSYYAGFDRVLLHQYRGIRYPSHFRPWAYGVSQHIIDLARNELPKAHKICVNYRNSHSVRRLGQERVFDRLPEEMLDTTREMDDWQAWADTEDYARFCVYQSAGRHAAKYNQRIGSSAATACFGGVFFILPWIWNWPAFKVANYFVQSAASIGRMQNLATKMGLAKEHAYCIYQWDSWRLWESFANGSAPVHVDFERYGLLLPEMPQNGKHYVGVDLKHSDASVATLQSPDKLVEIGTQGREWALSNYGPQAQAMRLLRNLEK